MRHVFLVLAGAIPIALACSGPHDQGTEARSVGASRARLVDPNYPPTANGVDAPVFGPVQVAGHGQTAYDGKNFVVVWEDERGATTGVAAARVSEAGVLLDRENDLIPWTSVPRAAPAVAFDQTNYLVVWEESPTNSGSKRIRGLLLGTNGRPLGAVFTISAESPLDDCRRPAIAFDGTNYLVVWHYSPSTYGDLVGARVTKAGAVLDAPPKTLVRTQASSSFFATPPGLAYGGGNYLVGWSEQGRILASRFSTDLSRLDASGVELGTAASSWDPAFAWDGTQYWAAWNEQNSSAFTSSPVVRRVSAAGTPLGTAQRPATDASGSYPEGAIGATASGAISLFSRGTGDETNLFGSHLDASSGVASGAVAVASADGAEWNPSVVSGSPEAPYFVAWSDTRHAGSAIYSARLDPGGSSLDGSGSLVSRALNDQREPEIAAAASGFLVAWIDSREGGYQVYAAGLDANGVPRRPAAEALASGRPRRSNIALASNGTSYLALWNDNPLSSDTPLAGRILTSDGKPQTSVTTFATGKRMYDPVVAHGGGAYLVLGSESAPSGWPLWGLRIDASGNAVDPAPFAITPDAFRPALASSGTDFLVVWRSGNGAVGLRLGPDGKAKDAAPFTITPTGTRVSGYPKVAYGGGVYFVVWENLTSPSAIFGVRVNPDGTILDATAIEVAAATTTGGTSTTLTLRPNVAYDGARFVVNWQATVYAGSGQVASDDYAVTPVTPEGAVGARKLVGPRNAAKGEYELVAVAATGGRAVVPYVLPDSPAGYSIDRVRLAVVASQAMPPGGACGVAAECTSGFCLDGVCCDAACEGGPLDCRACSVLAGARSNGVCSTVTDGHGCGLRGSCGAGACVEPIGEDGGPPGVGGSASTGSGGHDTTTEAGNGGPGMDGSAGSASGGASGSSGVDGSAGSASGGASGGSAAGGGGAAPAGGTPPVGAADASAAGRPHEDDSGCACRTAAIALRSETWPTLALIASGLLVARRRSRREVAGPRRARE